MYDQKNKNIEKENQDMFKVCKTCYSKIILLNINKNKAKRNRLYVNWMEWLNQPNTSYTPMFAEYVDIAYSTLLD